MQWLNWNSHTRLNACSLTSLFMHINLFLSYSISHIVWQKRECVCGDIFHVLLKKINASVYCRFYPHLSVSNDMPCNLLFVRCFYTSVSFLSIGASGGSFVVSKMVCFSSCFHCRSRPSNLLALIYIICHRKLFIATMAGNLVASVFLETSIKSQLYAQ